MADKAEWKKLLERNKAAQRMNVRVTREDRRPAIRAPRENIAARTAREDWNDGFRVKGGPTERVAPLRFADRVTANDPRA